MCLLCRCCVLCIVNSVIVVNGRLSNVLLIEKLVVFGYMILVVMLSVCVV